MALHQLGRYAEARASLTPMLAAEPDDAQLHVLAGHIELDSGSGFEALRHARAAIRSSPTSTEAFLLRSRAHLDLGQYGEAHDAAKAAVRLAPTDPGPHVALALSTSHIDGFAVPAAAAAQRAIELAPHLADGHFAAGYVAQRVGQRRFAKAAYHRALAIDPMHASARTNIANLHVWRLGHAARGYASVLADQPNDGIARYNLERLGGRFVLQLVLLTLIAILVATMLAAVTDARWPRVAVAAGMVAAAASYACYLWSRLPAAVRRYARHGRPAASAAVLAVSIVVLAAGVAGTMGLAASLISQVPTGGWGIMIVSLTVSLIRQRQSD